MPLGERASSQEAQAKYRAFLCGMVLVVEAVIQPCGAAGERQLPRFDITLRHGNGGALASQAAATL